MDITYWTEAANKYGDLFWNLGIGGLICAAIAFAMVILMKRWMHGVK